MYSQARRHFAVERVAFDSPVTDVTVYALRRLRGSAP
jgi:hypothetical protein